MGSFQCSENVILTLSIGNESRTASAATSATNNPAVESTPVSSNTNQKGGASKKLKMGDLANAFSMVRNTQQYDMTKVLGTDSLVNMEA